MNKSSQLALGGMITALCTSINLMASIAPLVEYTFPAFAGVLIVIVDLEIGLKWGWMVYFASSVLSILICPEKIPAIIFVLLFGYYPLVKFRIESIKIIPKPIKFIIKLIIFNIAIISEFWISIKVFAVPEESLMLFGIPATHVLLIMGNITFIMYDMCISNFLIIYIYRFQKKLRKIMGL